MPLLSAGRAGPVNRQVCEVAGGPSVASRQGGAGTRRVPCVPASYGPGPGGYVLFTRVVMHAMFLHCTDTLYDFYGGGQQWKC